MRPMDFKSPGRGAAADLKQAYRDRLTDAKCLLKAGRHGAAVTMATYAIEIVLKCRICRLLAEPALPRPFEIHDLEGLLVAAGLRQELNKPQHIAVKKSWQSIVEIAKNIVNFRYQPDRSVPAATARDFI